MTPTPRTVWAAGAVLWRRTAGGKVEVAVVHRRRYDDWSLPKGKADPGELLPATAVREVVEETGFTGRLGRHLDTVGYPLKSGARKRVSYWAMESTGGRFVANHETDDLQWLSVNGAKRTVSYDADRAVLKTFAAEPVTGSDDRGELHQLILVRHATAGRRGRFRGDDRNRPLDEAGREQARALAVLLGLFGAQHLYAADRLRCVQTLVPLSEELRTEITPVPELSEEAYAADPEAADRRLREIAGSAAPGVPVICSQGKVIPPLLNLWAARDGVELPASRNRKGSLWILTLRGQTLVQADHLASPLPGKNGH